MYEVWRVWRGWKGGGRTEGWKKECSAAKSGGDDEPQLAMRLKSHARTSKHRGGGSARPNRNNQRDLIS